MLPELPPKFDGQIAALLELAAALSPAFGPAGKALVAGGPHPIVRRAVSAGRPHSSAPDTGGPCFDSLTHVSAARDLPLAEFLLEVQPQDLLDLFHGLSLSGQLRFARF